MDQDAARVTTAGPRSTGGLAVVTGAASGIGAATMRLFRARGWDVLGIDRQAGEGIVSGDITDADSLAAAAATLDERQVDALVLAAGIWDQADDRYSVVSLETWERTWSVNVTGTMLSLRAFAPLMGPGGSVVTIASMAAISGMPRRDAYTASKGAVEALSRAWAVDLIRDGIRVNCLAPGVVATPMVERVGDRDAERLPLGRAATPEEVAGVAVALAGPELGYLNGTTIPVDGGLTATSGLVPVGPRRARAPR